jgi:hypothetical protein
MRAYCQYAAHPENPPSMAVAKIQRACEADVSRLVLAYETVAGDSPDGVMQKAAVDRDETVSVSLRLSAEASR